MKFENRRTERRGVKSAASPPPQWAKFGGKEFKKSAETLLNCFLKYLSITLTPYHRCRAIHSPWIHNFVVEHFSLFSIVDDGAEHICTHGFLPHCWTHTHPPPSHHNYHLSKYSSTQRKTGIYLLSWSFFSLWKWETEAGSVIWCAGSLSLSQKWDVAAEARFKTGLCCTFVLPRLEQDPNVPPGGRVPRVFSCGTAFHK